MLENYIFELVLNMIGIVDQCSKNYIVYEYEKWIELLNGDCVVIIISALVDIIFLDGVKYDMVIA